jgi:hypothetical protein
MKLSCTEQQQAIQKLINSFPETFGLKAYPEQTFRLSPRASFFNDKDQIMLYVQVKDYGNQWLDFAKDTEQGVRQQIRTS